MWTEETEVQHPLESEHAAILSCLSGLVHTIDTFRGRMIEGDTSHAQHYDFADRAKGLARYLSAALTLLRLNYYAPAYAVLRAALEHSMVDTLIFLARRYVQEFENVSQQEWETWVRRLDENDETLADVVSWERSKNGKVTVVRSGYHERDGKKGPRAKTISPYYFRYQQFDPFANKRRNQPYLTTGFGESDHLKQHSERNRAEYESAFSWYSVLKNLVLNKLFSEKRARHLDVHYTFLSAFVHPTSREYQSVYGRQMPTELVYDHYSSELGLLYATNIALQELAALQLMARRSPRVELAHWDEVEEQTRTAAWLTSHLWFPPKGRPHEFDRVMEANHRFSHGQRVHPSDLKDSQVRYYRNPLRRLVQMHSSSTELTTGLTYLSPWERPDARSRL